jgi:nitronate monooxygenase
VLANRFTERWRGRELDLLQRQTEEAARYDTARATGDFDTAAVIAGEAVDLISDIPPAGEIVERVATEAEALLVRASNRYQITRRA